MKKSLLASTLIAAVALVAPTFAADTSYTGDITDVDLSTTGGFTSGDTATFDSATGSWVTAGDEGTTFVANVTIGENGLTISSGTAGSYTFSGTITGKGDWSTSVAHTYIFTGDVSGYEGTLTVNNGSVTFDETGTATINTTLIKAVTLTFGGTANYVINGNIDGGYNSDTYRNSFTISTTGTVTFNGTTISQIGTFTMAEGSTLVFTNDATLSLSANLSDYGISAAGATIQVAEGKTLTMNKMGLSTLGSIGTLELGSNSNFTLNTTNTTATSASEGLFIGTLKIGTGSSTIATSNNANYISIGELVGTSVDLSITTTTASDRANLIEFGSSTNTSSTSQFTGTITMSDTANTGTGRALSVAISEEKILAGAVIVMGSENSNESLSLGINASRVEIAGLSSEQSHNGADILYSGIISADAQVGNNGANITSGSNRNTLVINTASADYTFYGKVLNNLNIEKGGTGKQTISFETDSSFDGSIKVTGGELALGGVAISSTGITVDSEATLSIGNEITLKATDDVTSVSSTISGTLSVTDTGSLALDGSVTINNAITNAGTITIADSTSIVVGVKVQTGTYEDKSYDYYVIVDGGSVEFNGSISNFTITDGDLTDWNVYTTGGGLIVYAESETATGKSGNNLVWAGTETDHVWDTSDTNAIWQNASGETGYYFTDGNTVTFGSESAYTTVGVESEITAGSITVNNAYTFDIGEGASVTTGTLTYADGGSLTLTGSGTFVFNAETESTAFTINSDSNFSGDLEVVKGRLQINGTSLSESTNIVLHASTGDGGNIYYENTDVSIVFDAGGAKDLTLTLNGDITLEDGGAVIIRSGDASNSATFTGKVSSSDAAYLQINGGGSAIFTGEVDLAEGGYLNFQGATTFSGKTTLGTLEFFVNGNNASDVTFSGIAAQATVDTITVDESAGSIAATLTVENGASLTITDALTIDHDFAITLDAGTLNVEATEISGSGSTTITISSGGQLVAAESVELNAAAISIVLGTDNLDTAALVGSGMITSTDAIEITVDSAVAALLTDGGSYTFSVYDLDLGLSDEDFSIESLITAGYEAEWNGDGTITIAGFIPEPSMFGVIFGLGALGLVATRRRRRKAA